MDKTILVTGATGYIASRLIPRLLERGYRVRALARHPHRLDRRNWSGLVEVFRGDVTDASSLPAAVEEVHTAYYLIHNMSSGRGYTVRELEGARNFASAAGAAGVQHIIYLGGLADPEQHIAPHLRSRIETGATLRQGRVPVTEFRAGVIVGSGSISFEMIRFITELFPVIPGPVWLKNKSQPIATQNVIDYLLAALENRNGHGEVLEIGGPEVTTYADLMMRYARLRGHKRRMLLLPYIPLWFMSFGIDLMTPVPRPIAYALVDGLGADSVVIRHDARLIFPNVKLMDYDSAATEALTHLHPARIERIWDDGTRSVKSLKHEGFFIHHREIKINASAEIIFQAILHFVKKPKWQIEINNFNEQILVRVKDRVAGEKWIEWRVGRTSSPTYLTQTAFFAPRGLGGFAYWYLLYPIHALVLHSLIRAIARQSQKPDFSTPKGALRGKSGF